MTSITLPIFTKEEWEAASECLSKSRLTLFDFCSIKYKLQYVDKCIPYESSRASNIGTRYHEFFERFMLVGNKYDPNTWPNLIHDSFIPEEREMIEWTLNLERERLALSPEYWTPIAVEYQVIDYEHKLRGIIDRIDQLDESTINVIEYKTTQSLNKSKLQKEFGFYDILLDSIKELEGYKRVYTVINPRLKQVVRLNPSRKSTIFKRIDKIYEALESGKFEPLCGFDDGSMRFEYSTTFCSMCSLEEIAQYNGAINYIA